ncbi:MAG: DNA repair protein RecO [Patescibacteria group bacterium]
MTEYFTEALVIDKSDLADYDATLVLYTKDLGRITAKAKSLRKPISKLSAHLEPLNFSSVRLIEKNGFQIVDALTIDRQNNLRSSPELLIRFLSILRFIKKMTFDLQADYRLWLIIRRIMDPELDEKIIYRALLKILGFDPQFAMCVSCYKKEIEFFSVENQVFLCGQCGRAVWKNKGDELILI